MNLRARAVATLTPFFDRADGAAVLVDVRQRRLIAAHGLPAATGALLPPGSTVKPFVLAGLLDRKKLGPDEAFPCPIRLSIGRYALDCSHPPLGSAVRPRTAIAYSCNCFVAHFAERFGAGELATNLERAGLASATGLSGAAEVAGRIDHTGGSEANRLQALGEERVRVTPAGLAMGYRWLALRSAAPEMAPILEGLEDAVEYGTGATGARGGLEGGGQDRERAHSEGARVAWFAGFAPSRAPEVVVAVMLQGRSGGADAAPVAGRILAA